MDLRITIKKKKKTLFFRKKKPVMILDPSEKSAALCLNLCVHGYIHRSSLNVYLSVFYKQCLKVLDPIRSEAYPRVLSQ